MHLRPEDQARRKVEKLMTNNPGSPFFCMVTPSDIAYVLAIIKNGKELWDQAKKRQIGDPGTSPEKNARPRFSGGEGRKRESGISVWNKEGLELWRKTGERCTIPRSNFWH